MSTYQQLDEPLRAAYVQSLAAYSLLFLGRPQEAAPLIEQALQVARAHERGMLIAFLLRVGANLSGRRGDLHDSRAKLGEALALFERLGASRHATTMIASLAELEFRVGNVEYAFDLATKCLTLQREGKRWRHMILTLANLAAYSVALNRWEHARAYARETLSLAQDVQHATAQPSALQHLAAAAILSATDDASMGPSPSTTIARAAQLIGYVDASASVLGFAREYTEQQEYDRVLAALRTSVPADDLVQLFAQGATLTLEAAIEIALSI
jgi:tetratricopeptide (TPR) repeat protein